MIQPMRTPGIPYAFDRPLVTMTCSLMPQKDRVRWPSSSAPRYTSSASSMVCVRSHRSTMRCIAPAERTAPDGLFGLER